MIDFEKILKTKGKTKADLARFLEIQANNVNRVILNENITLSKIETICKFLDISVIDALRLSGYDDTPGVPHKAMEKEKISDYKDLLLSLSDQLVELYNQKILAPYSVVEGKEEEIRILNREIGRLEGEINRLNNDFREKGGSTSQDNTVQDIDSFNDPFYEDAFNEFIKTHSSSLRKTIAIPKDIQSKSEQSRKSGIMIIKNEEQHKA